MEQGDKSPGQNFFCSLEDTGFDKDLQNKPNDNHKFTFQAKKIKLLRRNHAQIKINTIKIQIRFAIVKTTCFI